MSAVLIAATALWMAYRTWLQGLPHAHVHDHGHAHSHSHGATHGHAHGAAHTHITSTADAEQGMDAHARAHAQEIRQRFASGHATHGQILVFGLTGGLIPCPASITVLLLCLQLKQVALGATLVLSFSVGLALTMVASGVLAAWSVGQATRRWSGFGAWAAKASYISTILMLLLAAWMAGEGWHGLQALPS